MMWSIRALGLEVSVAKIEETKNNNQNFRKAVMKG